MHPALCAVSGVDDHIRLQGDGLHVSFATKPLTQGGTPLDPGYLPHTPGLPEFNHDMYVVCVCVRGGLCVQPPYPPSRFCSGDCAPFSGGWSWPHANHAGTIKVYGFSTMSRVSGKALRAG